MVEGGQHMDGNLYEAARRGRNIPGDVDDQQLRSRTPGDYNNVLHVAAQYGNQHFITLTVARLGEHRCQLLCQRNSKGETPLHLAAQFGNLETVRVLLTLHMALRFGHEDIALLLLDKDSHVVSIENDLGESLAFLAAENYCKRFLVRILNEDRFSRHVSLSGPSGQTVFHPAESLPRSQDEGEFVASATLYFCDECGALKEMLVEFSRRKKKKSGLDWNVRSSGDLDFG